MERVHPRSKGSVVNVVINEDCDRGVNLPVSARPQLEQIGLRSKKLSVKISQAKEIKGNETNGFDKSQQLIPAMNMP